MNRRGVFSFLLCLQGVISAAQQRALENSPIEEDLSKSQSQDTANKALQRCNSFYRRQLYHYA